MESGAYLGIDIGGTKTAVCAWSQAAGIRHIADFPTSAPNETLAKLKEIISNDPRLDFDAIGIACGSPLDTKNVVIQAPPNLPLWKEVKIGEFLENLTQRPVYLLNDANANALAEWRFG